MFSKRLMYTTIYQECLRTLFELPTTDQLHRNSANSLDTALEGCSMLSIQEILAIAMHEVSLDDFIQRCCRAGNVDSTCHSFCSCSTMWLCVLPNDRECATSHVDSMRPVPAELASVISLSRPCHLPLLCECS